MSSDALATLTAMGFNEAKAVSALQVTAGNVEQAANYLLTGGDGSSDGTHGTDITNSSGTTAAMIGGTSASVGQVVVQGTTSQYCVQSGRSACTCMALTAATAFLAKVAENPDFHVDAAFLDYSMVRAGSEMYRQWMQQTTGRGAMVEHASADDALQAGLFPQLQLNGIRQGMLSDDPNHPLGVPAMLSECLSPTHWTCVIMTKTPETVLLCLPPSTSNSNYNKYLLLDSHPRHLHFEADQAYVRIHSSLADLVGSVQTIFPLTDLGSDVPELIATMYNSFDLYPVQLLEKD